MSVILKHPPARKVPKSVLENKTVMHMKHVSICVICGYGFVIRGTIRKTCGDACCVNEYRRLVQKKTPIDGMKLIKKDITPAIKHGKKGTQKK